MPFGASEKTIRKRKGRGKMRIHSEQKEKEGSEEEQG
jgi:hypothetical protein